MLSLARCRSFGVQATHPSHDEDRHVCTLGVSPKLLDGFHPYLLETRYSSSQGIHFAQREELGEERRGTFVPHANGFLVLVKPLFFLPQEGQRKYTETDSIIRNAPYGYGLAELQKVLEVGVAVLVWLATKWASLHHVDWARLQLEVHIPNINTGSSHHIGG